MLLCPRAWFCSLGSQVAFFVSLGHPLTPHPQQDPNHRKGCGVTQATVIFPLLLSTLAWAPTSGLGGGFSLVLIVPIPNTAWAWGYVLTMVPREF